MAEGAVKEAADGSLNENADGSIVEYADDAETGCCCDETPPEEYECEQCQDCCFSTTSTATYEYDLTSITDSGGESVADWLNKTATLPYLEGSAAGGAANWQETSSTSGYADTPLTVFRECDASPTWFFGNDAAHLSGATPGNPETYYDVSVTPTGTPTQNDCCGFSGQATITVRKWYYPAEAEEPPSEPIGYATGTGTFTVTVNNNNCCKCSTGCIQREGDCDGACGGCDPDDPELPSSVAISGTFDVSGCEGDPENPINPCNSGLYPGEPFPEWDNTFGTFLGGSSCAYTPELNKCVDGAYLSDQTTVEYVPLTCKWVATVAVNDPHIIVWQGEKESAGPTGTYTRTAGCDTTPTRTVA